MIKKPRIGMTVHISKRGGPESGKGRIIRFEGYFKFDIMVRMKASGIIYRLHRENLKRCYWY